MLDVEIISKMRLEFVEQIQGGERNVLNLYGYRENFLEKSEGTKLSKEKSKGPEEENIYETEEYDEKYIFKMPKSYRDFNDDNFVQKHTLRIEVEKLNKRLFTSRLVLKSMRLTDIDLSLKGNRHVKIVETNKLDQQKKDK